MEERPITWDDLLRYHRDVFLPDLERTFRLDRGDQALDELNAHFAEVCRRLDKIADDLHALNVWLDERNSVAAQRYAR